MRAGTLLVLAMSACLGPQVSDEVGTTGLILPASAVVPSIYDDAAEAAEIASNDGVDGVVPLLSAFSGGAAMAYWDFGPTVDFAAPGFLLIRRNGAAIEVLPHPVVIGAIPGDPGYSPFHRRQLVEVTGAYRGEIFPSVAAIQKGVEAGLLLSPTFPMDFMTCAVVAADVRLEVAAGPPVAPSQRFYYDGLVGTCFDFGGGMLLQDRVHVAEQKLYRLRREGGEPLSEPIRRVDMNGDGDIRDSNDVFAAATPPLCRLVAVTVAASTMSIDDGTPEVLAEADLFDTAGGGMVPMAGRVIAYEVTGQLTLCPRGQ